MSSCKDGGGRETKSGLVGTFGVTLPLSRCGGGLGGDVGTARGPS